MSRMAHTLSLGWGRPQIVQPQVITGSWQQLAAAMVLVGMILLSAFAVVYIKDLNRRLFIQYQQLQQVEQQAIVDRGKLLLEGTTLAAQARVQRIAHHRLQMVIPSRKHIVIVSD